MIPPVAYPGSTYSERDIFARLELLRADDQWRCFHSLNLSEHEYKRAGELDFVILSPEGLLVLEVKGGQVRRDQDGVWTYTSRQGTRRDTEGPFKQADSGMYALWRSLKEEFGESTMRGIPHGYGVVLPNSDFAERSIEWSHTVLLNEPQLRRAGSLEAFLLGLYAYYRQKEGQPRRLDPDLLKRVTHFLRPSFDRVPSLRVRADRIAETLETLTEDQYQALDQVEEHPRLLFQGGAGTGKTFLALEVARRHASAGQSVLLTCSSPVLAGFIRSRLPAEIGIQVRALGHDPIDGEYDVLVVDEGQDVMNIPMLDAMDRALRDGLSGGVWRFFYDPNHQSGLVGRFETEALALLLSYGGIRSTLKRNCRNTRDIVLQTQLVTGADLGNPNAGRGPEVSYAYHPDTADGRALVTERVSRLLQDGAEPGDITILSMKTLEDSCLAGETSVAGCPLTRVTAEVSARWPIPTLTIASVAEFKGLENRVILVIDMDRLDESSGDLKLVYVGMSRAQAALHLVARRSVKSSLESLQRRNLEDVLRHVPGTKGKPE